MADIKAKKVRLLAPGGGVLNFVGVTGNSHFAYPVSTTLIKTALERNIKVFEELATPAADGSTEVELTLENYAADNGGAVVSDTDCVVPDIEKEVADTHAAEDTAWIQQKGLEILARNEAAKGTVDPEEDETPGGTGTSTIPGGTGTDTLTGGGTDSVPGGTGTETLPGGNDSIPGGTDTIIAGGSGMEEGEENG